MKISLTVFKLQSGHDCVTDGQTKEAKNNMSPPLSGGEINSVTVR